MKSLTQYIEEKLIVFHPQLDEKLIVNKNYKSPYNISDDVKIIQWSVKGDELISDEATTYYKLYKWVTKLSKQELYDFSKYRKYLGKYALMFVFKTKDDHRVISIFRKGKHTTYSGDYRFDAIEIMTYRNQKVIFTYSEEVLFSNITFLKNLDEGYLLDKEAFDSIVDYYRSQF